jgi:hypothetical protein
MIETSIGLCGLMSSISATTLSQRPEGSVLFLLPTPLPLKLDPSALLVEYTVTGMTKRLDNI